MCLPETQPGRRAWSRQQVQKAVDLLRKSDDCLTKHDDELLKFTCYLGIGLPSIAVLEDHLVHTTCIRDMLARVSWICKRVQLTSEEVNVFGTLCLALANCIMACFGLQQQKDFSLKPSLESQLSGSGLMAAISKIADALTVALQQHTPQLKQRLQQQRQQLADSLPASFQQFSLQQCFLLTTSLLQLWKCAAQYLHSTHPDVQSTVTSVVTLTMTAARAASTLLISESSSSGGSDGSIRHMAVMFLKQMAAIACAASQVFNAAVHNPHKALALLQQNQDMLPILLLNVACNASQNYHTQNGQTVVQLTSSSSSSRSSKSGSSKNSRGSASNRQQQRDNVPALHDALYAALGLPGIGAALGGFDVRDLKQNWNPDELPRLASLALSSLITALQLLELQQQQDQQQHALLTKPECHALMAAAVQLIVLQPDISVADCAVGLIWQSCKCSAAVDEAVQKHYSRDDWHFTLWTPDSAAQWAGQLLQLLLPAVQHCLQEGGSERAVVTRRSRAELKEWIVYGSARMLITATFAAAAKPISLIPVLHSNLSSNVAALELALRAHGAPSSAVREMFGTMEIDQLLHAIHNIAFAVSLIAGYSAADVLYDPILAATVAAAGNKAAKPSELVAAAHALLGLLVTCQKLLTAISRIEGGLIMRYFSMEITTNTKIVRTAATNIVDRVLEDPDGKLKAAFNTLPWVALLARCLALSGQALAVAAGPGSDDEELAQKRPPVVDNLQIVLQAESDDIMWLGEQLSTLAKNSNSSSTAIALRSLMSNLEDEGDDLYLQVRRCARNCSEGPVPLAADLLAEARKSVKLDVVQHMAEYGSAVAAAVPWKQCCNNTECNNLSKSSEAELVGGSRCSGCGVARYCSKDCQLRHWKQHKVACKLLKGGSTAQQG